MSQRYKKHPSFVLGFHGCDEKTGEAVLAGKGHLSESKNDYDWLGHGIYFWESNPHRAYEFAEQAVDNPRITKGKISSPFVVGAIIDLGNCCNLHDSGSLSELAAAYEMLKLAFDGSSYQMPKNKGGSDRLQRFLDCAVIETMHDLRENRAGLPAYDTVRCAFHEGEDLYPDAGFKEKTHIQIAVTNPEMILGYFRPIMK